MAAALKHKLPLAAGVAALVLAVLAVMSPDRQGSLGEFVASGPMKHIAVADVQELTVSVGAKTLALRRDASQAWQPIAAALQGASAASLGARVETGLRLLHNTPAERRFDADSPDFGLASPALRITVLGRPTERFEIEFGAANPMGLSRYARVRAGVHESAAVLLLPADVAQAWEAVASAAPP